MDEQIDVRSSAAEGVECFLALQPAGVRVCVCVCGATNKATTSRDRDYPGRFQFVRERWRELSCAAERVVV